jgi:mono/diheme cytochrome c family protein
MSWKRMLKGCAFGLLGVAGLLLLVAGVQVVAFDRAAAAVYDVEPLSIRSTLDSVVIDRGRHLAESIGGCLGCHGADLGGSLVEEIPPIGIIRAPNLTSGRGGVGASYTDGELARAIRHGIGSDGRSLRYMPTPEHNWWPDEDVTAVVSFVRSMSAVNSEMEPALVLPMGKVLSQFGVMALLSAEMVDHNATRAEVPAPEATARYGALLARACTTCHGERLSGGKIPGAPSSLAIPANLTPHETGLRDWTIEQFFAVIDTGIRPDGRQLDPFMPIGAIQAMDDTERGALWAYLRSLEPVAFGNR